MNSIININRKKTITNNNSINRKKTITNNNSINSSMNSKI